MLVINLEEFRPWGQNPKCYERMETARLATDVNSNRHEFACMAPKRHSQTPFGVTQMDFVCSQAALYHCKI